MEILKSVQHLSQIGIYDEWETPPHILEIAINKYKIYPEIDLFATLDNTKYPRFFTKENSVFSKEIRADSFANPPYSIIEKCINFIFNQWFKHNANFLILTYAKTDTKWWHNYIEEKAEVHFIKGRIKFLKNGQRSKNSAPYPSCWIIYRKKK